MRARGCLGARFFSARLLGVHTARSGLASAAARVPACMLTRRASSKRASEWPPKAAHERPPKEHARHEQEEFPSAQLLQRRLLLARPAATAKRCEEPGARLPACQGVRPGRRGRVPKPRVPGQPHERAAAIGASSAASKRSLDAAWSGAALIPWFESARLRSAQGQGSWPQALPAQATEAASSACGARMLPRWRRARPQALQAQRPRCAPIRTRGALKQCIQGRGVQG